jgi:hypothetical protein
MTRWWEAEGREMYAHERDGGLKILDMAAGRYVYVSLLFCTVERADERSGEATICLLEWEAAGKGGQAGLGPTNVVKEDQRTAPSAVSSTQATRGPFIPPNARRSGQARTLFSSLPPDLPSYFRLYIEATDPVRLIFLISSYRLNELLVYLARIYRPYFKTMPRPLIL